MEALLCFELDMNIELYVMNALALNIIYRNVGMRLVV